MTAEALQKRIKTTQELREIVKNMKALSSVSIWQYTQANKALEKCRANLRDAFHALVLNNGVPQINNKQNAPAKYLYILIGTDNGMVGKFNKEIIEKVKTDLKAQKINLKDTLFIIVGKRLAMIAVQSGFNVYKQYGISNSVKVVSTLAENVILDIDAATRLQRVTNVTVYYHKRQGSTAVNFEKRNLLPIDKKLWKNNLSKKWETNNFPMVGGDKHKLFKALVNESLMIDVIRFLNSSLAAEHFTRMTAMQEAENNIDENLERMNLEYQQQRQENITDELIDVISGADAMRRNNKKSSFI